VPTLAATGFQGDPADSDFKRKTGKRQMAELEPGRSLLDAATVVIEP
jgi:hypothetical protein